MGISFGSIGTGLPKDIVKQLIAAERIPIERMEMRKGKFADKKKLVEELIALMEGLKGEILKNGNARSLRELSVATKDDIVGVTVDKNIAHPGNYQLEVLELAQKSSAMSSGFEDREDSYVGVGYIHYSLPNGDDREIYVDSANSSLNGISKLINSDATNGMRASVVNDGSGSDAPWRLIISLEGTGDMKNADFPYFYFVDGDDDFFLEFEREAKDARIKLDGFEIEVPANKVSDLIPGVTLDLRKAKPGEEFSIGIGEDAEAITSKITDLVEKINSVLRFVKAQNQLDEKSDTSRTLGGDSLLQSVESRLRSVIFKDIQTEFGSRRFGDLGVSFQRDGTLALDDKKFTSIMAENYQMVSQVLTGRFTPEGKHLGFIDHLKVVVSGSLRNPDGILQSRRKGIQSKIDQVDRRVTNRQRLIEQKEKNLKQKFARLESTISKLKNQSAGLSGLTSNTANPVEQLG